jgi:hypothetical protein
LYWIDRLLLPITIQLLRFRPIEHRRAALRPSPVGALTDEKTDALLSASARQTAKPPWLVSLTEDGYSVVIDLSGATRSLDNVLANPDYTHIRCLVKANADVQP